MSNFTRELTDLVEIVEFFQERFNKTLREALEQVAKNMPHVIEAFLEENKSNH